MTKNQTVTFEILRMDPFGQGVSQADEKILFIPDTLPGEKGTATITDTKGQKVLFGKVENREVSSPHRKEPDCIHFDRCQGCSYLHTSYEEELKHKKAAYSFLFKKYKTPEEIEIIGAPERLHYRNRLQLHYDLKKRKLGFLNDGRIQEVPQCLLGKESLQNKLKELYQDSSWTKLVPRSAPTDGHLELYEKKDGEISVAFNEPYAHGGFSQVYEAMGLKAKALIQEFFDEEVAKGLPTLDVFGGSGFLSGGVGKSRVVCDSVVPDKNKTLGKHTFVQVNLFEKYAMARVEKFIHKHIKDNKISSEGHWNLIIDPPRSGFKTLGKLTNLGSLKNKVHKLAYLSCNPQSFKRDLDILMEQGEWQLEKLTFLDFFPGTHHLESLAFLSPKSY